MLIRIVRLTVFVALFSTFLMYAACGNSSAVTSNTSNTNTATANSNVSVTNAKSDEQEISRLLDEYNDALLKKDAEALDRIWADDLSFVNLRGQMLSKKERMENIKTGATELKSAQVSEKNVRIYGDAAVGTLIVNIEGQYSGQEGSGSFRITTVWAKPKGNWQMVATQMTPISK